MKTSRALFPLFAALAVIATPCLAQPFPGTTTTVTFATGTGCNNASSPAFNALSVMQKVSNPVTTGGGGAPVGRPTVDDIILTKSIDDCSVPLYALIFQGQHIKSVVISLHSGATEVLRLTLSDVFITSLSEAESVTTSPAERLTLSYGTIVLLDPATGTTTTFRNK